MAAKDSKSGSGVTRSDTPRSADVDWDDLRVFLAIARTGSFRKAANDIGLTLPTVTRKIGRLEEALDAILFKRTSRGPELTYEGEMVLAEARSAEVSIYRAADRIKGAARSVEGDCRVLVPEGLNSYWLPHFLPAFLERYPALDLRLFSVLDQSVNALPQFDVQIQLAPTTDADSIAIRLGTLHLVLHGSQTYFARNGRPERRSDLARHSLLDHAQSLTTKGRWTAFSDSPSPVRTALFTNSSVVLAEAVRRHVGMALLPSYSSAVEEQVVPVLMTHHLSTGIYANFTKEAGERPPVRAMIDFFKTVVFSSRMPWFTEEFQAPTKEWRGLIDSFIARASMHATATTLQSAVGA